MIETLVYERLQATIGPLVGGSLDGAFDEAFDDSFDESVSPGRIYPIIADENTLVPFVLYSVVGQDSIWTLNGPLGFSNYQLTIASYAYLEKTARDIIDAIIAAFDGWRETGVVKCKLSNRQEEPLVDGFSYNTTFDLIGAT